LTRLGFGSFKWIRGNLQGLKASSQQTKDIYRGSLSLVRDGWLIRLGDIGEKKILSKAAKIDVQVVAQDTILWSLHNYLLLLVTIKVLES
jgi:hypothetical protein